MNPLLAGLLPLAAVLVVLVVLVRFGEYFRRGARPRDRAVKTPGMLAARFRRARVPADGRPLDAWELRSFISLMHSWQDKAATRAVAAAERHAEELARTGKQS